MAPFLASILAAACTASSWEAMRVISRRWYGRLPEQARSYPAIAQRREAYEQSLLRPRTVLTYLLNSYALLVAAMFVPAGAGEFGIGVVAAVASLLAVFYGVRHYRGWELEGAAFSARTPDELQPAERSRPVSMPILFALATGSWYLAWALLGYGLGELIL